MEISENSGNLRLQLSTSLLMKARYAWMSHSRPSRDQMTIFFTSHLHQGVLLLVLSPIRAAFPKCQHALVVMVTVNLMLRK